MTNTAEKISAPLFTVRHNGDLLISLGKSRYETAWKNKTLSWAVLLNKLARSQETPETHAEYMKMSKEQQDRIKDIGGFVGGHLKDGRRQDRLRHRPPAAHPRPGLPSGRLLGQHHQQPGDQQRPGRLLHP